MRVSRQTRVHTRAPTATGGTLRPALVNAALLGCCLVSLCLIGIGSSARAEGQTSGEYALKAAFLYNFAKFVEWPEDANPKGDAPLTVCLEGNAFGSSINSIEGKEVRGHPIAIRRNASSSSLTTCHLLFLSHEQIPRLPEILPVIRKHPILTICDSPGCAKRGLMINLRMIDKKVSLEINLDAIQRTPLKVSSHLLKLASLINEEPQKP